MNIKPAKERLSLYRDYNYNRALAYKLKLEGTPFTRDLFIGDNEKLYKVITTFNFTNVRRELDRESVFLINSVINNYNFSLEDRILNTFMFRGFNTASVIPLFPEWPIPFSMIDGNYFEYMTRVENERRESDENLKRLGNQKSAYLVSPLRRASNVLLGDKRDEFNLNPRLAYYVQHYKDTIIAAFHAETSEESINTLVSLPGVGWFLGYQIWVDFTYFQESKFNENDLVVSGPGCDVGIDWMVTVESDVKNEDGTFFVPYGFLPKNFEAKYNDFCYYFTENLQDWMDSYDIDWNPVKMQEFLGAEYFNEKRIPWGLMQVENSFCEYNKLQKYMNDIPTRRKYYSGNINHN